MRNIPVFTTETGVASLTLEEIPYKQEAYIIIHDSRDPRHFLEECAGFCYAAGAQRVFVSGVDSIDEYTLYTRIMRMGCSRDILPGSRDVLVPVTEQTVKVWTNIYNERMKSVPCTSTITHNRMQELVRSASGYFIYRGSVLLGIGKVKGSVIEAVAGCVPGVGRDLIFALNTALTGKELYVEVSDRNYKAIKLYKELGFTEESELNRWYVYQKITEVSNKNT